MQTEPKVDFRYTFPGFATQMITWVYIRLPAIYITANKSKDDIWVKWFFRIQLFAWILSQVLSWLKGRAPDVIFCNHFSLRLLEECTGNSIANGPAHPASSPPAARRVLCQHETEISRRDITMTSSPKMCVFFKRFRLIQYRICWKSGWWHETQLAPPAVFFLN